MNWSTEAATVQRMNKSGRDFAALPTNKATVHCGAGFGIWFSIANRCAGSVTRLQPMSITSCPVEVEAKILSRISRLSVTAVTRERPCAKAHGSRGVQILGSAPRESEIIRGEKSRKIRLTPAAVSTLKTYLPKSRKISEWVFPATDPACHADRKRVRDWHAQTLKRMPGAFVPYVMRHTALTRLANVEAVSLPTVAAFAGHSSISVTQRYVHPQKNDIRKALELKTGERIGDARRREVFRAVENTGSSVSTKLSTVADVDTGIDSENDD
jgi:Phage integrase family